MAQLVVSAVGAAVGFMIGGPAGAQIGWVAGSMVGAYAFAETQTHEGPRLKDLKITGTDYGDTIPWVAGSPRIAGQIIWASPRRETKHEEDVGGKGSGGGATQVTYTYDCDLLIMLSENARLGVARIWSNNELVWTGSAAKDGAWRGITVHDGDDGQFPDPIYEAAVGMGNAPAYRGRTTVMIQSLQLGGSGNIPNLTFEIGSSIDPRASVLVSVIATRVDTDVNLRWDAAQTTQPTWHSYFSQFKDVGAFRFLRYTETPGRGDTELIVGPYTVPIDVDAQYHLSANNAFYVDDICAFALEFLNVAGDIVAIISSPGYLEGSEWTHRIFYEAPGHVPRTQAGPLDENSGVQTSGFISFESGLLRFARHQIFGGNHSFAVVCNARSIRSVRVRNVRASSGNFYPMPGGDPGSNRANPTAYVRLQRVAPDVEEGPIQALDAAVHRLLLRAGYSAADFDVEPLGVLTKPLRALALSQVSSTRSALEVLQKCWHFECAASEKLYLRPRATAPVVRIPFTDLGYSASAGGLDDPLAIRMGNDLEMPAQIALTYPNMAGDYNADSQFSDRLISGQQSTQTVQVPVGMLPAEAKGVVDAMLMDGMAGLQSTTLSVPLKYAYVEPGDVVEAVAQDGRIYRLRVQTKKDQGIWLELECKLDDVGALDSAAITDEGYVTVQDPTSVPDTILHVLDLPILRDADDAPGFYLSVAPDSINVNTDQWKGANTASSWDDVDYASLLTMLDAATVGECLAVLPNWAGGPVFDEASVLQVEMLGQLASMTRAAMLLDEGVNALLVGDEIIRFRNAELIDSEAGRNRYTYQLTGLIRGCRGTEWAMGGHVAQERCVLLNRGLRRVNTQLNELLVQRWIKATTVGKYISDVQPQVFTDTGRALKPFSPAGLRALPEAGLGVHVTWQRRTRLSYRYGGADPVVPLGEASERYRVQVFAGATLLRTETVTQPAFTYTTAMATEDELSAGDPVRFEVSQLSESVGAGYITTKEGFTA